MVAGEEKVLLTLAEAAARVGCSESNLRKHVRSGRLKATRLQPSGWLRIDPADLDALTAPIDAHQSAAREPAAVAG